MALVKCENCGAPVSNLGTKCPKCGTPIRKGNDESANEVNPAKPKRRSDGMVGLIVVVIVVAVGAAAFLLLGGKGGGNPQTAEVSDSDTYQEEYSDDAEDYLDPTDDWDDNYQEEYCDDAEDLPDSTTNWENDFHIEEVLEEDESFQPDNYPTNAGTADGSLAALGNVASTRKLVYSDISSLNKADLRLLRNTIYARRGYIFKSDDLKSHFSQYPWYSPRYTDVSGMLSDIEKYNVSFIQKYE